MKDLNQEIIRVTKELMNTISTLHLDMGGNHRYSLNHKSHKLITELNALLYKKYIIDYNLEEEE